MNAALTSIGTAIQKTANSIRRHPFLLILGFIITLAAIGAFTPEAAFAKEPGPATRGFEHLLMAEDLRGDHSPTLYEAYPTNTYFFDTEGLSPITDFFLITLNGLATVFMMLTVAIVRGAIVLMWTMFSFPGGAALSNSVSGFMGTTATELMAWLLPTALALGGIIAYVQNRSSRGGGLGQAAWVFAGALLAVSFAAAPNDWVSAFTTGRNIVSSSIMSASVDSVQTANQPFEYSKTATYADNDPQKKMLRSSADAIWRAYVVTPWCLAEFGSKEACERYGQGLLDQGTDVSKRSDWIKSGDEGHPGEFDKGADSYRWISGKNSHERLGMSVVAFLVAAVFSILIITVSFLSLLAFVSALMLLFVGVFFVTLWCIPGRPRAWGNRWLETVFGLMIQSVVGTLVISVTLIMTASAFGLAGDLGWALAAGLSIMICIAAATMRRTVSGIMEALTPGAGMTTAIGSTIIRSGSRLLARGGRGLSRLSERVGSRVANSRNQNATVARQATVKSGRGEYSRVPPAKPRTSQTGTETVPVKPKPSQAKDKSIPAQTHRDLKPAATQPTTDPPNTRRTSTDNPNKAPGQSGVSTSAKRSQAGVGGPHLRNNPPSRSAIGREPYKSSTAANAASGTSRQAPPPRRSSTTSEALTPRQEYPPRRPPGQKAQKR